MTASPTPPLAAEVRALRDLPASALRRRYEALTGRPSRSDNRDWLLRGVVRLLTQGARLEGRNARRALSRAVLAALSPRTPPRARPHDPRIPPIGSVLRRPHGDVEIEVRVLRDGFRFEGRTYPSLSAVATAVTGAHWNGLLWFGLAGRTRLRRCAGDAP